MLEQLTVVSIDDNNVNLMLIEAISKDLGFNIRSFLNPVEAVEYIEDPSTKVDLILVDYMMPEMSGIEVIQRVRKHDRDIPVIMITAMSSDADLRIKAIEEGATEFLHKPLDVVEFKARLRNMSELRTAQLMLMDKALLLQSEVEKAISEIREREYEALEIIGKVAEYKDKETGEHTVRVAFISKLLAAELGESEEFQNVIEWAAPLHDVGKVGIPDNILNKAGPLSDDEFEIMRTHTTKGYMVLKDARSVYLQAGAEIALSHHERWDGNGYPGKLAGEDIPLMGRIVAVADVFDAVSSKRPYKDAWDKEKVFGLFVNESGTHFDPRIVDALLKNKDKIWEIHISQ